MSRADSSRRRAYLSVCAVYRDEAPYLREWVELHRLVGVERFYLYNNGSTDEHREMLAPYLEEGLVELREWPLFPGQLLAYEDTLRRHREDSRWIAFIDLDEFLFSPTGRPVSDVLQDYERWPGVVVNWAVFGTSGHLEPPPGLVIENYVRRTDARGFNRPVKSIVDPQRVAHFCGPHFFTYREGYAVDENCRAVKPRNQTDAVTFSRLRVNHYMTKSEREYRAKLTRPTSDMGRLRAGKHTETAIARRIRAWNEVHDDTIQMYVPELRAALARIDAEELAPVDESR